MSALEWVHMVTPTQFWWPAYTYAESMHPNAFGHEAMANCVGQVYTHYPQGDLSCAAAAYDSDAVNVAPINMQPAPLGFNPGSLDFGGIVLTSHSPAQSVTLTNHTVAPLAVNNIGVSGDFAIASNTCPATLAVYAGCSVSIAFALMATAPRTGALTITDSGWTTTNVPLSGTGLSSALSFSGTTSFGDVEVGLDQSDDVVVHNDSAMPVTVTGATIGASARQYFSILSDACTGQTLGAGQVCNLTVDFAPRLRVRSARN
jgi:hypothetical protein